MMPAALSRRAHELAKQGAPFVTATVVRAQRPTSVEAGDAALVLGDGTIEGFVGGACAEHSVRAYALKAIETGEAVMLRILPFGDEGAGEAGEEVSREDGAVTVQNPCLSGGAIEVFLEPILRAPRILVEGDTPIARSLHRIGPELGLEVVAVGEEFVNRSVIGTRFGARIVEETEVAGLPAVVPEISGRAWITAMGQYLLDPDDPFPAGFAL